MTGTAARGSRLTVAALAREAEVSPDTVRYYERIGLLPPPARSKSGYRQFPPAAIDRLLFIQGSQRFGLRLREIKELLAVRDTGRCPCEPAEDLLRRHITEVDAEMRRLAALRTELTSMANELGTMAEQLPDGCPDPTPGTWCPPGRNSSGEEVTQR